MPTSLSDAHARTLVDAPDRGATVNSPQPTPVTTGDRQPVHTVYGGAHLFTRRHRRALGAAALRALEEYAPDPGTFARAVGLTDLGPDPTHDLYAPRRRQAAARAGRGLPHRLRGRLRQPPRRRGGRPRRSPAPRRWRAAWPSTRCRRSSASASSRSPGELHRRALRTLDLFLTDAARSARGGMLPPALRRHAAQGHVARAGHARWSTRSSCSRRANGLCRGSAAAGADGRDAAVDLRPARRDRCCRRLVAAARRPLPRRALRHLRLHRRAATSPRRTRCRRTRRATSRGTCMQVCAGRHRRHALGRRDDRDAGRPAPRGARRPAADASSSAQENMRAVHTGWRIALRRRPHVAAQRLLPGLGPEPGAAADALRRGVLVLPRSARGGRRAAHARSSTRRRRRRCSATCSTTPRPARACSTSSCAGINCGALTEDEALATGLTLDGAARAGRS